MRSTNLLVRKLEAFHPVSHDDRLLLEAACVPIREIAARRDIIRAGETPCCVYVVLSGFACRYKTLENGERQIVSYLIPGDLCDFNIFILNKMDHSIGTLSRCQIVELSPETITRLIERPAIAKAFWWSSLVCDAITREWLTGLGKRSAASRIAHLFCELLIRMKVVGLVKECSYSLPLTQADIADSMGLTVVYANRMLMSLRQRNLIAIGDDQVVVKDFQGLVGLSGFDPQYLHMQNVP